MAAKVQWSEGKLLQMLRTKYHAPKHAMMTQVTNGTGYGAGRYADAIVHGLCPSEGLHMHGFEVKVTRADWRREMQDLQKAEAFAKFCDYWWIVAPPKIVKLEELPATWGLMEPGGGGLKIRRPASKRIDKKPITTSFLAALLRYACRASPAEAEVKAERHKAVEDYKAQRKLYSGVDASRAEKELKRLQEAVGDFEKASGVKIKLYSGGRIGEAVEAVLGARLPGLRETVRRVEAELKSATKRAEAAMASLKEA